MEWYENLYIGKNAQKESSVLIREIEKGSCPPQVYLLTLASSLQDQVEIISCRNLKFWYSRKKCPMILGLALGKEEALEVLQQIVQDVLQETGGVDIRSYVQSQNRK